MVYGHEDATMLYGHEDAMVDVLYGHNDTTMVELYKYYHEDAIALATCEGANPANRHESRYSYTWWRAVGAEPDWFVHV